MRLVCVMAKMKWAILFGCRKTPSIRSSLETRRILGWSVQLINAPSEPAPFEDEIMNWSRFMNRLLITWCSCRATHRSNDVLTQEAPCAERIIFKLYKITYLFSSLILLHNLSASGYRTESVVINCLSCWNQCLGRVLNISTVTEDVLWTWMLPATRRLAW